MHGGVQSCSICVKNFEFSCLMNPYRFVEQTACAELAPAIIATQKLTDSSL